MGDPVTWVKAGISILKGMTVKTFIAGVAAVSAINYAVKALVPDVNQRQGMNGMTISRREPALNRSIIYGTVRVGGALLYSGTTGNENEYLYQVYAIADTGRKYNNNPIAAIDDLLEIYFDKERVATHNNGTFTYYGKYINGSSAQQSGNASAEFIKFQFFDGSQTSASSMMLETPDWGTSCKLKGVAYVACRFKYDQDVFPNGLPNVSFKVKGRRVYDPTNGSMSSNNPNTWAYSNNSALCLMDYMTDPVYGLNLTYGDFDIVSRNLAIGVCNQNVALAGTSATQDRYTCDGLLLTSNTVQSNVEDILSSMAGKLAYSAGKFHIYGNANRSAETKTVDEDMMVGAISVVTKTTRRNQFNVVQGKFASEEQDYVVASYPTQENSTYITEDNERLTLDLDLPFTTDHRRAQRIAKATLEKSRLQSVIKLKLNLEAMKFKVGDIINVEYPKFGYNPKRFEIQNMRIIPDEKMGIYVEITALEDDPNQHDWDENADELVFQSPNVVNNYDGSTVTAPFGISADFTVVSDIHLNVTPKLSIVIRDNPSPYITHYQLYVYKIPEPNAVGHREYLSNSHEFTLTRDFGIRKTHTIDVIDKSVGHYRVSVQAVNISGVYSDIVTAEYEITEEDREQILAAEENRVIVVQQSGALSDEPNLADVEAAKGSPLTENDEIIYQQVQNGTVVDSKLYNYKTATKVINLNEGFARSTTNYRANSERIFVDVWVAVNAPIGGNWSYQLVSGTPMYNSVPFANYGTVTIYDTSAEVQTLYDETVEQVIDGLTYEIEVYRGNYFLENVQPMSTTQYFLAPIQKALFRFELNSQYATSTQNAYSIGSYYKLIYTHNGTVYETPKVRVLMGVDNRPN